MRGVFALGLAGLLLAISSLSSHAIEPGEVLDDTRLEERARLISKQLRCVVCQNQAIDDSDAQIAKDMRVKVRQLLVAGATDEGVKQYFVTRYGDFVLLEPPFRSMTIALWLLPLVLAIGAMIGLALMWRRRLVQPEPQGLSLTAEEEAKVAALLEDQAP